MKYFRQNGSPLNASLIFVVCLALLVACSVGSGTSLLKTDCNLPCWNDIIPGKTTKDELLNAIKQLPSVIQSSIEEEGPSLGIFDTGVHFTIDPGLSVYPKARIFAGFQDDTNIVLLFSQKSLNMNFGEMIALTGQPDWVITVGTRNGTPLIRIVNIKQGVAFGSTMQDKNNISEDTPIDFVLLFEPDKYAAMLDG
jgi:hypothetical protein